MRSHVVLEEVAGLETGTFQFTIKCFSDTRVWLTDPVSHFCHICTWLAHMCLAHIGTDMWSSVFSDMTGHCFSNVTPRLTFSLTAQVYLFLVWFISGRRLKILHGLGYSTQFHTFFILLYGAVVNGGKDYKWLKLLLGQQKFQPLISQVESKPSPSNWAIVFLSTTQLLFDSYHPVQIRLHSVTGCRWSDWGGGGLFSEEERWGRVTLCRDKCGQGSILIIVTQHRLHPYKWYGLILYLAWKYINIS